MSSDDNGSVYALSRRGPTFHLPPRWSVTEPHPPGQQFRMVRDNSDGSPFALCWFYVGFDERYDGLTGRQILSKFYDPRLELEEWEEDVGTLDAIDEMDLNGLPALRSLWTAVASETQAVVSTRMIATASNGYVVVSSCAVCEANAAQVASDLDDIQLSLRARVSPLDAPPGSPAAQSHRPNMWLRGSWPVIVNALLPIAFLFWLLRTRASTRGYFLSIVLLATVFMALMKWSVLGMWHIVGTFWPTVFLLALVTIIIHRLRRGFPVTWFPRPWSPAFFVTVLNVVLAAVLAMTVPDLLQVRAYSGVPLELSSPLRNGRFYVMGGGASYIVNWHSGKPFKYALDITRLNAFGVRAAGVFPDELTKYAAFGAEVIAPCSGEVISVASGFPNRTPWESILDDWGNQVVLYCEGHSVQLAHLDPRAITVAVGDRVKTGQALGRLGSSGSVMEPHLHLCAVQGRHTDFRRASHALDDVTPTPLLIDGKFFIKGDSFTR